MYIFSLTLTKEKIAAVLAILLIITVGVVYFFPNRTSGQEDKFLIKNTNEGRIKFIRSFGWEVDNKLFSKEIIRVPSEFDKGYSDYEKLQNAQGLSLLPYKNKQVTKYTYRVLNYKDSSLAVYINLFVYNNRVIAADLNSPDLKNGFIDTIMKVEK